MCAYARKFIVEPGKVTVCHCIAETSRQAFLCGKSGRMNVDHRMKWITDRLTQLAGSFALDLGAFAILDTRLHVVVRQRPDIAKGWSGAEIHRKWQGIFDKIIKSQTEVKLEKLQTKAAAIQSKVLDERRERLASASWFMRCLNEIVARAANKEEGVKGRFWAGRFRSQAVLDNASTLASTVFVDLRKVIGGKTNAPAHGMTSLEIRKPAKRATAANSISLRDVLSPFKDGSKPGGRPKLRASNDPWLPLKLEDYQSLVEWTAAQVHRKKPADVPIEISQILAAFNIDPQYWVECVINFDKYFRHAAGSPDALSKHVELNDRQWHHGLAFARKIFV